MTYEDIKSAIIKSKLNGREYHLVIENLKSRTDSNGVIDFSKLNYIFRISYMTEVYFYVSEYFPSKEFMNPIFDKLYSVWKIKPTNKIRLLNSSNQDKLKYMIDDWWEQMLIKK